MDAPKTKPSPPARAPLGLNPRLIRRIHTYCGVLFAPAILFFAISGAVQVLGLHESKPATGYAAPALLQAMGSLHKNQALPAAASVAGDHDHADDHDHGHGHGHDEHDHGHHHAPATASVWLLKGFVIAMSVTLAATTLLGLYLSLQNRRERPVVLSLFGLGVVIPVVLARI